MYDAKFNELLQKLEELMNIATHNISTESPECFISYCWKNSAQAVALGTRYISTYQQRVLSASPATAGKTRLRPLLWEQDMNSLAWATYMKNSAQAKTLGILVRGLKLNVICRIWSEV